MLFATCLIFIFLRVFMGCPSGGGIKRLKNFLSDAAAAWLLLPKYAIQKQGYFSRQSCKFSLFLSEERFKAKAGRGVGGEIERRHQVA